MAIAKNPKRNLPAANDRDAEAFISGAGQSIGQGIGQGNGQGVGQGIGQQVTDGRDENKKPIMVRVDPDILERIDRAAKRLGISRSAFIVSSTAEKLERME